jgi:2-methylisocitrate lyase-like PEP mutase family enzyme
MPTVAEKRTAFRRLHEAGCFVIPNPWDAGSARYLEHLGFQALASTSSGAAWSLGLADNRLSTEQALAHIQSLAQSTALPLNADFENGFAADPDGVGRNVRRCLQAGVAALSLEDASGDPAQPLYAVAEAVARLRAARAAIDAEGGDALLVGRTECLLGAAPAPLAEAIRRLRAYAEAGADVLFAPGLRTREDIGAVVQAVTPWPVNVLALSGMNLNVAELAALGVRRVSVGGGLARAAWGAFIRVAAGIAASGDFSALADGASGGELNALFARFHAPPRDGG